MNFHTRLLLPIALAVTAASTSAATATAPVHPSTHARATHARAAKTDLLPRADADQIRDVVIQTIQALADNDAERMFAVTTPEVRKAVGSSGRFLAMMHGAYPMVSDAQAVNFQPPRRKSDGAFQMVEIKDGEDKSWLAVFILEQQPDHSWRVSGCAVTENPWLAA